jgi:hypothetical protein
MTSFTLVVSPHAYPIDMAVDGGDESLIAGNNSDAVM